MQGNICERKKRNDKFLSESLIFTRLLSVSKCVYYRAYNTKRILNTFSHTQVLNVNMFYNNLLDFKVIHTRWSHTVSQMILRIYYICYLRQKRSRNSKINRTKDDLSTAKIRKEGFRKVFHVWTKSHFSDFEV